MTSSTELPWTTGQDGDIDALTPGNGRRNLGGMISPEDAEEAVNSYNAALAARKAEERARHLSGLTGVQIGDGNEQNNNF